MILTRPAGDPAMFKIKRELLPSGGVMLDSEVRSGAAMEDQVDEKGQIWVTIFWDVTLWVRPSNEEAVTYSRNFRSFIFECDNIETDLIIVRKLLYDTFINVGMDFNQALPLLPALACTDVDVTAAQIMELFVDRGMY